MGRRVEQHLPLVWRRRAPMAPRFELVQESVEFGEMVPSTVEGFDAWGECFGRSWEIERPGTGLGAAAARLHDPEEDRDGPSFRGSNFQRGSVRAESGAYRWSKSFVRVGQHELSDLRGQWVLRLRTAWTRLLKTETLLIVRPNAWELPDLPELILLTWFLRAHTEPRFRIGRLFGGSPLRRPNRRFRVR